MRIRQNLGSVVSSIGKGGNAPSAKAQVGKVYGIVTTENTPTEAMFKKAGGFNGIGTIFYLDYSQAKNTVGNISEEFLNGCKLAKPLYSQYQYFPILGELVLLEDLPSPTSQVATGANQNQKYYVSVINVWNNPQQNAQPTTKDATLGVTFTENKNIRSLLSFEGDHIVQGRQGNAIRFSTTTKLFNNLNEWSSVGKDDDPITILSNGLAYDTSNSEYFYVEKINEDKSSIYLTSTQKIPLQTSKKGNLNNLTNPLNVPDYFNAQVIINSDRVVLNSKKDEVMVFAQTNIELNTQNIINLNADKRIHLNSPSIFLGTYNPNKLPQPVLLGNETINLFLHIQQSLASLADTLSSMIGVPEGAPMTNLNAAGRELSDDMKTVSDLLQKITSQNVFTI